jgi:mediator of replication checkpoint protein 1
MGLDPSQPRIPLQTLSLTTAEDYPDLSQRTSLKRLRKRDMTERDEFSDGIQSSLLSLNFSKIKAQKAAEREREHKKLGVSEFIEAEAVLSDEDEMHGFGGFGKADDKDEEGDGEDLDKTLEELMDDKEMHEEELAKVKVLEKHQFVALRIFSLAI